MSGVQADDRREGGGREGGHGGRRRVKYLSDLALEFKGQLLGLGQELRDGRHGYAVVLL